MRKCIAWIVTFGLALFAVYQQTQLERLQQIERHHAERVASLFPYTLRRADFRTLPRVMTDLATEERLEEKIALFKQAQALAVAFTDDLLMLNDLRYSGPGVPGGGLQYGDYLYRPATPEQESLQWKILKARLHTTLWAMERKFYLDEGQLQPADQEALNAMTEKVQAIGEVMERLRAVADQHVHGADRAAAQAMEELAPLLKELERVASTYEAELPPFQPKPGGLYERLYGK